MKFNKKKIGVYALSICMMTGLLGCSTQGQTQSNSKVVVLPNQQSEVNNTLKLKKIDEIKKFDADRWIDNDWILGHVKKDNEYLLNLYNTTTKKMMTIAKSSEELLVKFTHNNKNGERLVIFKDYANQPSITYIYNLNTNKKQVLCNDIYRNTDIVDDKFIIVEDDNKIYKYDFNTYVKNEIVLPVKLRKSLFDFNLSYEEYISKIIPDKARRNALSDYDIKQYKLMYKDDKANPTINELKVENDNIFLRSDNFQGYVYDIKTKQYSKSDFKYDWYAYYHKYKRGIEKKDEAGISKGLFEVNKNGMIVNLIDDNKYIYSPTNSNNNKKIAYYTEHATEDKFILNVYDFDTKRSISLPWDYGQGLIRWNKDATKLSIIKDGFQFKSDKNTVIYTVE
ncbi:hypothetical protein PV797_20390 [Clostridiaceae bacterium M8S5]|nr:hypothetical protein PV797_20390 [Clostridiaceae bacterium M8S5]